MERKKRQFKQKNTMFMPSRQTQIKQNNYCRTNLEKLNELQRDMTYGIIIVKEWFDIGTEMQDK